jgi:hypothetical protein
MKILSPSHSSYSKSTTNNKNYESKNIFNQRLQSDKFYCHYSNGVYMGGMNSYKRNGKGILLLDDGSSAITNYCFNTMQSHNVIFR